MANELIPANDQENYLDYHFKSHSLIYASADLSAQMMNIFALMLTSMKEEDWTNDNGDEVVPEYSFDSKQLCEWFGIESKQLYATLKRPSQGLAQREIGIEENGSFRYRPILSEIMYEKGTLTISPNSKLRNVYIVNAGNNGHAKIDNKIFKALGNPNAKRVFEFLSRYRYDKEMYFINIRKLQVIFDVMRENGTINKKSYARESDFIDKVIRPALKAIAKCPEISGKLEVLENKNKVGYELVPIGEGRSKIRFLVKWKNQVPKDKIIDATRKVVDLLEQLKLAKQADHDVLPILIKLQPLFKLLGREEQARSFEDKIAEIKKKRAIEKSKKERASAADEMSKVDLLLSKDLLDGI